MDKAVQQVLDAYHKRMHEEAAGIRSERDERLLAVGPETGQLIDILARSLPRPRILELGTSYGYSTIWLAEAARAAGGRVTTIELQDYKSAYARDMAKQAGLDGHVDFLVGDALALIETLPSGIDFVLVPCLEAFLPKLSRGAILVADNMIWPGGEDVARYGRAVRAKPGMTSILLPVGSGIEISRLK